MEDCVENEWELRGCVPELRVDAEVQCQLGIWVVRGGFLGRVGDWGNQAMRVVSAGDTQFQVRIYLSSF
jgi:hypothetical protein